MEIDRPTAIHEAGHAVIGRVLGLLCGHATITPDDDSGGHSIIADAQEVVQLWETTGRFREHVSAWRGRIMAMQAGVEVEIEILGTCCGGDGMDRSQIALMAELFEELSPSYSPHARDSLAGVA